MPGRWWLVGGVLLVLIAVVVISARFDDPPAQDASRDSTSKGPDGRSGSLTSLTSPDNEQLSRCRPGSDRLARCGPAPALRGISGWLNTSRGEARPPSSLRGRVVLVDFWAYSCVNCRRHQPYLDAWYDAYRDTGLEIVGVHSPQQPFERDRGNVVGAVRAMGIRHPVALDPTGASMTAYRDRYWPATYLVDATGVVRALSFGEGGEARTERLLRALLREARPSVVLPDPVTASVRTPAPPVARTTPETRLGWSVTERYRGEPARPVPDVVADYSLTARPPSDSYSLGGRWRVGTKAARAVREAHVRISAQSRRVYAVVGGTGTLTVRENGRDVRTVEVTGRPDLHLLLDGDRSERRVLTIQASDGLDVYAISFG